MKGLTKEKVAYRFKNNEWMDWGQTG